MAALRFEFPQMFGHYLSGELVHRARPQGAGAVPAYFPVWALLQRTGLRHIHADTTQNSNAAIMEEALGPLP